MMRRRSIAAAAASCCLLAGCSATVAGSGHLASADRPTVRPGPPGQPLPGPPLPSSPAPTAHCPQVRDTQAGLSFRCIAAGMAQSSDPLWSLNLSKQVEPGWLLGEGCTAVDAPAAAPLGHIAEIVRGEMVALDYWGPSPAVRTLSSRAVKLAGVDAWVQQTEYTINAAYRSRQKLKVRTERTWIVVLRLSSSMIGLWYVTVPDDVEQLWAEVPAIIGSIRRS